MTNTSKTASKGEVEQQNKNQNPHPPQSTQWTQSYAEEDDNRTPNKNQGLKN
jgi:hypothetical protein